MSSRLAVTGERKKKKEGLQWQHYKLKQKDRRARLEWRG
jgi:hypothetical protein